MASEYRPTLADRVTRAIQAFIDPELVNDPTPTTQEGLRQYDHTHPLIAVMLAWTQAGANPGWHRIKQRQVRKAMPLLGKALDQAEKELTREGIKQEIAGRKAINARVER